MRDPCVHGPAPADVLSMGSAMQVALAYSGGVEQVAAMHPFPPSPLPPPPPSRLGQDAERDLALVHRMACGDEAALGELYDRWSGLVSSVVMRICRDPDDAAEVVEEAFWQAWRQADRYEPGRGGIGAWLTTIARSRALDRARARGRSREDVVEVMPEPESGGGIPDPYAAVEIEERRRLILSAVSQLPPDQRQAVEMAYFGGLSQSEIAEAIGQPLGTVKTRARLALRKLREALGTLREEGVA
jgi:RNA polymerase sigma-70 factor, ECF subfamily